MTILSAFSFEYKDWRVYEYYSCTTNYEKKLLINQINNKKSNQLHIFILNTQIIYFNRKFTN